MNRNRQLALAWLILSQLGSLALLVLPWLVAFAFSAVMLSGGALYILYPCLAPLIPQVFIGVSWSFYARRKYLAAALTSGLLLLLSIAVYIAYSLLAEG